MRQYILSCQSVSKGYQQGSEQLTVLKDIDFTVQQGETVAIVGVSGAGKSTLLNLLGGLDHCTSGKVELAGKDFATLSQTKLSRLRNEKLGFVYQAHHLLQEFDAAENVAMPLLIRGVKKSQAIQEAKNLLDKVGLSQRYHHRPQQLSGGERQRVAIARALVGKPACVLMDEPTGNLDELTAQSIEQLLQQLNQEFGIAFVVVTHDKALAAKQSRTYVLSEGLLTEQGASVA